MRRQDQAIKKGLVREEKKRPSIDFFTKYSEPVTIITKRLNDTHILQVIERLEECQIPYQMQQETTNFRKTSYLKNFVMFDNKLGDLTLGSSFHSELITLVGYPMIGKNKKCQYAKNSEDLIELYKEYINQNRELIKKSDSKPNKKIDFMTEKNSSKNSLTTNKIRIVSITKKQNQQNKDENIEGTSLIKQRTKLVIFKDSKDKLYDECCLNLMANFPQQCNLVDSFDLINLKNHHFASKFNLYYFVNIANAERLLKNIDQGQVVVFSFLQTDYRIKNLIMDKTIFGVFFNEQSLKKVFEKIIIPKENIASIIEKRERHPTLKRTEKLMQSFDSIISKKTQQADILQTNTLDNHDTGYFKEEDFSLISGDQAGENIVDCSFSQKNESNNNNSSKQTSGVSNLQEKPNEKKITRLNKNKEKKLMFSQYFPEKEVKQQQYNEMIVRISAAKQSENQKKGIIVKHSDGLNHEKKHLKFKQDASEQRKVRVMSQTAPQTAKIVVQQVIKNTNINKDQNQKKPQKVVRRVRSISCSPFEYKFQESQSQQKLKYNTFDAFYKKNQSTKIHGILYRQFDEDCLKMANMFYQSLSFSNSQFSQQGSLHSFINMSQYDRCIKKIKQKSALFLQKSELNFAIFLSEAQIAQLYNYCQNKSLYYDQEELIYQRAYRSSGFSNLSQQLLHTNVVLFVNSKFRTFEQTRRYNKIYLKTYFVNFRNLSLDQIQSKTNLLGQSVPQSFNLNPYYL